MSMKATKIQNTNRVVVNEPSDVKKLKSIGLKDAIWSESIEIWGKYWINFPLSKINIAILAKNNIEVLSKNEIK